MAHILVRRSVWFWCFWYFRLLLEGHFCCLRHRHRYTWSGYQTHGMFKAVSGQAFSWQSGSRPLRSGWTIRLLWEEIRPAPCNPIVWKILLEHFMHIIDNRLDDARRSGTNDTCLQHTSFDPRRNPVCIRMSAFPCCRCCYRHSLHMTHWIRTPFPTLRLCVDSRRRESNELVICLHHNNNRRRGEERENGVRESHP